MEPGVAGGTKREFDIHRECLFGSDLYEKKNLVKSFPESFPIYDMCVLIIFQLFEITEIQTMYFNSF